MITLKTIWELPHMKDIKPLYPVQKASEINVESIAILEVPVEDFIRKSWRL